MALRMVDDAGVLACGAVVLALVLRLLVGYARRSQRRPVAATADNDAEGLSEPLLSEQPQPPQREPVYVLRSPVFRWLREACAILLGAAYVVRAYTLFYHGEVAVAGTRLVLIAIGWWLLAQVEEGPGLTGPMPAPAPESHAWLTLTLGYLFYLVLAIHPLLVKAEGSTAVVVVVGQLCVAALAMALLALEGVVALAESRRRQPQPQPQPQQGRSVLFKTLHVPPTPEQTASFLSTITFGCVG